MFSLVERDSAEPQLSCEKRNQEESMQASSSMSGDKYFLTNNMLKQMLQPENEAQELKSHYSQRYLYFKYFIHSRRIGQEGKLHKQNLSNFYHIHIKKKHSVSRTIVTYRNCPPWEKPIALYPPFNFGS